MSLDINRIFIDKKMNYLTSFQKMVLDVTLDFMNLNEENYEERINHLLESIGIFFKADRSYLFTINDEDETMVFTHEWCNARVNPSARTKREIRLEKYPWWIGQLMNKKIVQVEDVNTMPVEARVEQK